MKEMMARACAQNKLHATRPRHWEWHHAVVAMSWQQQLHRSMTIDDKP
jgi:hypothetical protein